MLYTASSYADHFSRGKCFAEAYLPWRCTSHHSLYYKTRSLDDKYSIYPSIKTIPGRPFRWVFWSLQNPKLKLKWELTKEGKIRRRSQENLRRNSSSFPFRSFASFTRFSSSFTLSPFQVSPRLPSKFCLFFLKLRSYSFLSFTHLPPFPSNISIALFDSTPLYTTIHYHFYPPRSYKSLFFVYFHGRQT